MTNYVIVKPKNSLTYFSINELSINYAYNGLNYSVFNSIYCQSNQPIHIFRGPCIDGNMIFQSGLKCGFLKKSFIMNAPLCS